MSIVNVFLNPESALIAVDTDVLRPDGTPDNVSKMVPIVHMNAVLGYRGCALFLETLFALCHMQGGDFDSLMDEMPKILRETVVSFARSAASLGLSDPVLLERHNVVLVGWSPQAGRMIGRGWWQDRQSAGFEVRDIHTWYAAPFESPLTPPSAWMDMADILRLASDQVRLIHEKQPDAAAGGRLIVAQVVRDSMHISDVGALPAHPTRKGRSSS